MVLRRRALLRNNSKPHPPLNRFLPPPNLPLQSPHLDPQDHHVHHHAPHRHVLHLLHLSMHPRQLFLAPIRGRTREMLAPAARAERLNLLRRLRRRDRYHLRHPPHNRGLESEHEPESQDGGGMPPRSGNHVRPLFLSVLLPYPAPARRISLKKT